MSRKLLFSNERTRQIFQNYGHENVLNLMFDTGLGKERVSKKDANDKIREVMNQVLELGEKPSRKEIKNAMRRHKIDVYEVIEEVVPNLLATGWGDNPFFREFVEERNLDTGATNEFYAEDDVILTVSEVSGNHHDLIRERLGSGQSYSAKMSYYGVKLYTDFELFMAGIVDWATYIQKIYEAFDYKVNTMLHDAVMSAGDKVLPVTQFTKTIELKAENKDKIIELVDDVALANGCEAVIMGTKTALAKLSAITPVEYYSDNMKDERNSTGRLGVWNGIRLVEIPQAFAPNTTSTKLEDNKKLLVMPLTDNKFIKLVYEGTAQFVENTDSSVNRDMTVEAEYQQKMGIATVINRKFGQIKITE